MTNKKGIILTIGNELLMGQTIDTNSAWIARQLQEIGIEIVRRLSVADEATAIFQALQEESARADLIITTGGLGPTSDDITKQVLVDFFHTRLVLHEASLQHVADLLQQRDIPMLERNRAQALIPEGCTVLFNRYGTAPGLWFEAKGRIWIFLPGVPHEMQYLMENEVLPRLKNQWPFLKSIQHRFVITYGQGESRVAERLGDFEATLPVGIKLAYLPGNGLLKLRLTAIDAQLHDSLESTHQQLISLLSDIVIATEDLPYEQIIARKLLTHKASIGLAESCTGGYLAHLFTAHAGSSAYFTGSIVCYAPAVKINVLHVPADSIDRYGIVSEPVARAMAEGARQLLHTDFALAITGWLGPDGGTPEAPIGTIWIAAAHKSQILTHSYKLRGNRNRNLQLAATHALHLLDELIKSIYPHS
ncbi:MAG: CinA family nicotinamide mononucleotide deamidase-related protein [Thermoflavifilum sp.]|nr:CinA family nicotinamide mononucleotide deamidase-related protein [Thermoflavifilum sp.]